MTALPPPLYPLYSVGRRFYRIRRLEETVFFYLQEDLHYNLSAPCLISLHTSQDVLCLKDIQARDLAHLNHLSKQMFQEVSDIVETPGTHQPLMSTAFVTIGTVFTWLSPKGEHKQTPFSTQSGRVRLRIGGLSLHAGDYRLILTARTVQETNAGPSTSNDTGLTLVPMSRPSRSSNSTRVTEV